MSQVIFKAIRLSGNPNTTIADNPEGVNGKVNLTSEETPRAFVILEFESSGNPFKMSRAVRTYSQNTAGKWPGLSPKDMAKFVGKTVADAEFVTEECEPYAIGDRTVNQYTTVVLAHENAATVFRNAGHPLIGDEDAVVQENLVSADILAGE